MAYKVFTNGTIIDSPWLNDVNEAVYNTLPGKVSAVGAVLTTPNIGNATATTVNGITFTQSTGTLTIPIGATATVSGVNTGDQNLTNYAQFSGSNTWTGANSFGSASITGTGTFNLTKANVLYQKSLGTGAVSGAITLDASTSSSFGVIINGNSVITLTGLPPSGFDQTIYIKLVNAGAYTTTFASGTKFPGGAAPTFTASGQDLLSAWYDPYGSAWVVGMVWKDYK